MIYFEVLGVNVKVYQIFTTKVDVGDGRPIGNALCHVI
jgi:hypothetical protein